MHTEALEKVQADLTDEMQYVKNINKPKTFKRNLEKAKAINEKVDVILKEIDRTFEEL